eukprot:CAMPEP_0176019830 /NCGR_PEP_ID=MMETSP0120_2-20121206/9589_1 /TAXON_ID=160619 /ORGANISM="Kryptoperidinium foliaceum, Strain CCMP 1326" /LENGTH=249 /DNA_ID=CAMNT_0017352911 /DNA_START=153 /DNA_END=902 /DNA_ORIENTATION=-
MVGIWLCLALVFDPILVNAFVVSPVRQAAVGIQSRNFIVLKAEAMENGDHLMRVDEEDEGVAIPFLDKNENSFIECYADSVANLGGVEYTIGVPCDYCVALCYFEPDGNLVPLELNDDLMDDIFPVAENIVMEEFGEELALQRTPQTLTLVGELEEDDEDEFDEDDENEDDEDSPYTGEEDVEVLLSFEHRGTEYNLVRLLDPVLLVGKRDPERPDLRNLLTPEESEKVMPKLEQMFLQFHSKDGTIAP